MSKRYAEKTSVPIQVTQNEIQMLLKKHGATAFAVDFEKPRILFEIANRTVQIFVPPPDRNEFSTTPIGRARAKTTIDQMWEQAYRQRWRAILLLIKAKLEAIELGITSTEKEFMANYLLANGQTLAEYLSPQLKQPDLLPKLPE